MDEMDEHGMIDDEGAEQERAPVVQREAPQPEPSRAALVKHWNDLVDHAKREYEGRFKEMRRLQRFARGDQWDGAKGKYVSNVTLRHLRQQVSRLYAKNPKAIARARPRIDNTVWDGRMASVQQAMQTLQLAQTAQLALSGAANPAAVQAVAAQVQQASAVLKDYQETMALRQQVRQMGRTLELLYDYNVDEQSLPFKAMLKRAVLQAKTVGVSYVKLGFQRVTQLKPDYESRIADISTTLRRIEQASADIADGKIQEDSAEVEQLRAEVAALTEEGTTLLREGLTFDYPSPTSIIPDTNCRHLKSFLGCRWVAQEYLLPLEEVQRIYGVDVSASYTGYSGRAAIDALATHKQWAPTESMDPSTAKAGGKLALVREIYDKDAQLVYVTCCGFPDFLRDPARPDAWTERFWPWYPLVFNDVDDPDDAEHPFPPSDVELIEHAQREINRAREGLREHRIANRPGYGAPRGTLSDDDKNKLQNRAFNEVVELDAVQPGQDIKTVLQGLPNVPIDPNLYETNGSFEDILRAGGLQEANLGPTAGATATESSIAQASLSVVNNSDVDELDDLLTLLARGGGQILLLEVKADTVREIVGPGAVWPELSREAVVRDLWLEVEAGSTGRPNQALEIANAERLVPLLLQIPGVSPEALGRELIRRLDDRLDIDEMLAEGMPSIAAMNHLAQPAPADPSATPEQQGPQGSQNVTPGREAPGTPAGADTNPGTASGGAPSPGTPGTPGV